MDVEIKVGAVIVAAGSGLRFGERKQFKNLKDKPLYQYSLEQYLENDLVSEISLVVPSDIVEKVLLHISSLNKNIRVVAGGELRQDSVLNGVNALGEECELVSVHDAARPFLSNKIINDTIETCAKFDGAVAAIPASDTIKEVVIGSHCIKRTIPRDTVWLAQTPQVFRRDKLLQALAYAKTNGIVVTDESTLLESLDFSVAVVESDISNFKITTPSDWINAETVIDNRND